MASLFVIQGSDKGRRFELSSAAATIGRDVSNPIRIHDNEVSRKHAELRASEGDQIRLVDLGSANGTYLNNELVTDVPLRSGDRIQVGQTVLLYSPGPAANGDLTERVDLLARANPQDRSAIIHSLTHKHAPSAEELRDPGNEWLKARMAHLSVLYEASQAISHVLDLDELLPQVLQLVFESINADRSVILLGEAGGALTPKAVRWRGKADPDERLTISQTIVDHVRETGTAVVTTDAPADARFSPSQSIADYAIREAICVPVQGRHSTLGVLYADALGSVDSLPAPGKPARSRFTQEHLMLMMAIGQHAGLAIENTEFLRAKVQSERLAAIGETITILSHHIKNILQGLRGGSYLIDQGLRQNDAVIARQGWAALEKNQERIYGLVMDMLSFSKEREPNLELVELNQVVSEVLELIGQRAAELGIALEWTPDPRLPPIAIDAEGIHRAILNIANNALDACEGVAGARVLVSTTWDAAAQVAKVCVEDNGPGIPADELEAVFEPFASTKGARGTGLGLPVSRKTVREHGGDLHVESEPGRSARFVISLPQRPISDVMATISE